MRTAIIGGRDFTHEGILFNELDKHVITSIVSGGARGADLMGKKYPYQITSLTLNIYLIGINIKRRQELFETDLSLMIVKK